MAEGGRETGTVTWFSGQKGYGFIKADGGGEDLFVYQTSIRSEGFRSLSEGEPVEFAIERGDDGRSKAVDVTGLGGAPLGDGGLDRRTPGGDFYGAVAAAAAARPVITAAKPVTGRGIASKSAGESAAGVITAGSLVIWRGIAIWAAAGLVITVAKAVILRGIATNSAAAAGVAQPVTTVGKLAIGQGTAI